MNNSKYNEDELIALFVETLTGTTFEMTVSPHDTIMSIKNKIQRVEGIPVSQQHLLYNLHELQDSAALIDYSITNGSTIKLVLSMRGGPISTVRRILPLDDVTWKEIVDFNRDDLMDDFPPGCRMAVLVFREGDQLNMFRVLENIDGSYSPLSNSWSTSSLRNLFEEEDSDECTKRLKENTITMAKMNDLKNKLEELAIQRKNNKLTNLKGKEELETIGCHPSLSVSPCMPSSGMSDTSKTKSKVLTSTNKAFFPLPPLDTSKKDNCSEPSASSIESRVKKSRTTEFSRVPVLPDISSSPPPSIAVCDSELESVATVPRPKSSPDHRLTEHRICEILSEAGRHRLLGGHRCSTSPFHRLPAVPPDNSDFTTSWTSSSSNNSRHRNLRLENSSAENQYTSLSSSSAGHCRATNASLLTSDRKLINRSATLLRPFNAIFQSRRNGSGSSTNYNSRVNSLFSNKKILEKHRISGEMEDNLTPFSVIGKPNRLTLSSLLSPPESLDADLENNSNDGSSTPSKMLNNKLSLVSNEIQCRINKITTSNKDILSDHKSEVNEKLEDPSSPFLFGNFKHNNSSNCLKPIEKKKKRDNKSRCAQCHKRLTVTNTYTCRCANIFCTHHRYSETHDCSYDYKTEGRKIIEQNNPLISAPKLKKI